MAKLEAENEAAKPLHERFERFGSDIAALKVGQVEIQTTLRLLVTDGHNSRRSDFIKVGGGFGTGTLLIAALVTILKGAGWL